MTYANHYLDNGEANELARVPQITVELKKAAETMNEAATGELCEPEGFFADWQRDLTAEAKSHVLFQILGETGDPDTEGLSQSGKQLALELAETIGPDYAQLFYRFAVLVTKLA